jgi:hypothetical protein
MSFVLGLVRLSARLEGSCVTQASKWRYYRHIRASGQGCVASRRPYEVP